MFAFSEGLSHLPARSGSASPTRVHGLKLEGVLMLSILAKLAPLVYAYGLFFLSSWLDESGFWEKRFKIPFKKWYFIVLFLIGFIVLMEIPTTAAAILCVLFVALGTGFLLGRKSK